MKRYEMGNGKRDKKNTFIFEKIRETGYGEKINKCNCSRLQCGSLP